MLKRILCTTCSVGASITSSCTRQTTSGSLNPARSSTPRLSGRSLWRQPLMTSWLLTLLWQSCCWIPGSRIVVLFYTLLLSISSLLMITGLQVIIIFYFIRYYLYSSISNKIFFTKKYPLLIPQQGSTNKKGYFVIKKGFKCF